MGDRADAESEFIIKYKPYKSTKRAECYKLIDCLCLFWVKYVESKNTGDRFMTDNITSDIMKGWRGVAFEEICWRHTSQIKHSLGISGIKSQTSAWSIKGGDAGKGAQIDLLIFRADNVVNLCEIKFSSNAYNISADEDMKIRNRIEQLKTTLSPKQTIHFTMITTYGVASGKHSGIIQRQVTMDDLFAV